MTSLELVLSVLLGLFLLGVSGYLFIRLLCDGFEVTEETLEPKIVVMCGSSRFVDIMAVCAWLLERDEKALTMGLHLLPIWYNAPDDHLAEAEGFAEQMDELHLRKIDLCDEIFVINHLEYIGSSTSNEIAYAKKHGKKIRYFIGDKVGVEVLGLMRKIPVEEDK